MKPASSALKSLLATQQFYAADLYTFALVGGGTLRYCGGDRDITANGSLYPAGGAAGPYFDRKDNKAKCHWKVGVEVDQLVFDILPGTVSLIAPFPVAPAAGDAFQIYPGCDKTLDAGGCPKFANTARFRGFPYVPTPETAV